MKIIIEWGYCTDGDFSFRPSYDEVCGKFEYEKEVEVDDYTYYDYYAKKVFDSKDYEDDTYCMFDARTYVKKLLVDTHISYTHYYIMEDIYNMIEPIIKFINKKECGEIYREMGGNYDGTFVGAVILDE